MPFAKETLTWAWALGEDAFKLAWISPIVIPLAMPLGLSHIEAQFCWCDPIVTRDENGDELVLHREVTWN